ncbi:sugar ABC transporter permease [Spirochaetia bacterium]|nr:sugar ABC transporter permease [Spirochaetia bacterium]
MEMRMIFKEQKRAVISVPTAAKYVVLSAFAVLALYPFIWVLISSLKTDPEIFGSPFSLPSVYQYGNFYTAWVVAKIGDYFGNSVFYTVVSVFFILLLSSMVSYVITRVEQFRFLQRYFTLGIMIPVHAVLIPTFVLLKTLGMYNTRIGFICILIASHLSLSVFILSGYMKSVPKELDEAALIDGCSFAKTFFIIILPISKPGLATVGTLTLLNCWNEYLYAYIMLANAAIKTITQGIFSMQGQYVTNYAYMCAGLVIAIVPVMLFYVIFQEQVMEGITAGAIKG